MKYLAGQRVWLLSWITLALMSYLWTTCSINQQQPIPAASKPNVLFISIDDLNDWTQPIGGHPQAYTPNLQRLAQSGITFTNAHAAAPLCNPSRVALLTGLHPLRTGIVSNNAFYPFRDHLPEAETMIQHFNREGYYTAGFGKIHHRKDDETEPWDRYERLFTRPRPNPYPGHGNAFLTDSIYRNFDWQGMDLPNEDWSETIMANRAIEELKGYHDAPFFLAVGFRLPHLAWHYPKKYKSRFDSLDIVLPPYDPDDLADVSPLAIENIKGNIQAHDTLMATGLWQEAVKGYLATIAYIDDQVGRILNELEQSPHAKNTIVVVWGDHGFHLGEKSTWRKNTLWEEATKTSLYLRTLDKQQAGMRVNRLVSLLDIYPTLVQLCGLLPRIDLDGQNLYPLLEKPNSIPAKDYLVTTADIGSTVRTNDFRYIQYVDGSEELYDRRTDELERNNVVKSADYQKDLQRLRGLLLAEKRDLNADNPMTRAKD